MISYSVFAYQYNLGFYFAKVKKDFENAKLYIVLFGGKNKKR